MEQAAVAQPDYDAAIRAWQSRAPFARRFLARIGLQGKLIICFMSLMMIALGGSCWMFVHQSRDILDRLSAHDAAELAAATGRPVQCGPPTAEINAALNRSTAAIITCNVVAALLAVPAVMLLVFRIFVPIRQLVTAADQIADGNLTARVAIHRPDAIGTLARSFNKMACRLRDQQTALEQANERLAQANADLEQKVCQRTSQLEAANRRLNVEMAEKEDFLRAISHDLSAPLRNISGMTAMLLHKKRDGLDDEVVHRLERIQKNIDVETGMIGQLLELSKIKVRRQRIADIAMDDLVREVVGIFEQDLQSRGIRLVIRSPLPVLRCERTRMRQVFQNLIDNAVKYMGDGASAPPANRGTREISIGCEVRNDEAEFYVRDTGLGIDADDLQTIFYVFRRGRNAAVQAIAGKGVGLACVKTIIETYNGRIWVDSTVGRGSTFRFTINGQHLVRHEEELAEAI